MGYNTSPKNNVFAEAYNFPKMGFGFAMLDNNCLSYNNNSHLSNFYTIYGFFERPFVRTPKFKFGWMLRHGVGFTRDLYDPFSNPTNYFGTHALLYISVGLQMKWRIAPKWELGLDTYFFHHSNGKTSMPNSGMDELSVGAHVTYDLVEPYTGPKTRLKPRDFDKGFKWDIAFLCGVKAFEGEWMAKNEIVADPAQKAKNFTHIFRRGLTVDALYRYSLKCATGIGIDFLYTPKTDYLRECDILYYGQEEIDKYKYSPVALSIGAVHEMYYSNFALTVGLGGYLYRHVGPSETLSQFYQTVGFRYYFPSLANTFVGLHARAAYFTRVDYLEFIIGIRI